jgi:hypothetical protein
VAPRWTNVPWGPPPPLPTRTDTGGAFLKLAQPFFFEAVLCGRGVQTSLNSWGGGTNQRQLEINAGGEGSWEVRVVDGLMGLAELSDVCAHPSTCCFDKHRYVD